MYDFMKFRWLLCSVYLILIFSLFSCAAVAPKKDIAAYVDNDPVTIGDIEYSLQIAHRREGLSKTKSIEVSDYVNKVIDERLLVHEAIRMNLDTDPGLLNKVDAFILRESVTRLYNDEVLSKVQVSEDEVRDYYKKEYEQYTLSYAETNSVEDAGALLETIHEETDFNALAQLYGSHEFRKFTVQATHARKDLNKKVKEVIDSLEPGETGNVFKSGGSYYIIRLISRNNASEDEFEMNRERIKELLKKKGVEQRSAEYLEYLVRKMTPEINQELLSSIPVDVNRAHRSEWLSDKRVLVKLRESTLTVGEFVKMLRPGKDISKVRTIKQWIDPKAVDYEALDRRYDMYSDLKDHVTRYKNKMLVKMFVKNELSSGVKISDQDLQDYYVDNHEDFFRPIRYKLQQITSNTRMEAENIKRELMNGADFSWMAKNKSIDKNSFAGGMVGWQGKHQMPSELQDIIEDLEPGLISDITRSGDLFRIYRVQEKTESKVEDFDRVSPDIYRRVFAVKYEELYESYLTKLRSEADIVINDEVIQDLDRIINNSTS